MRLASGRADVAGPAPAFLASATGWRCVGQAAAWCGCARDETAASFASRAAPLLRFAPAELTADASCVRCSVPIRGGLLARRAEQLARDLRSHPFGGEPDPDTDPDLDQNEHVGAVDVTTVVGAKGLSADHVIVLGCDDVNMAWVSRNAFFVAITRARASRSL